MTSLQWHRFERCAAGNAGPVCRSGQVSRPTMVPLAGIEPALSPPEGDALSAELQGHLTMQRRQVPTVDSLQKRQL